MVSCQKGPTRYASAWQIGPFCQDTLDIHAAVIICSVWTPFVAQAHFTSFNISAMQYIHIVAFVLNEFNTLRPRQNGRHVADIFKCIFLNENVWTSIQISLKFVPKGPIDNISALVQIMAWRRPGNKPLSEPMLIILLMHICITRPQSESYQCWGKARYPQT